jgi:hypothetical protein
MLAEPHVATAKFVGSSVIFWTDRVIFGQTETIRHNVAETRSRKASKLAKIGFLPRPAPWAWVRTAMADK